MTLREHPVGKVINELETHIRATTVDYDPIPLANVPENPRGIPREIERAICGEFVKVDPPRHPRGRDVTQYRVYRIARF
jgi:hypothetical protein